MDRDKVLELAREVFSSPPITHIGTEKLVAFAALIEREVRGDAEPVAFIGTDGSLGWLKKPEALYSKPVPLFTHPALAVVRQLVEALEFCRFSLEPYDDIKPRDWKSDRENLRRAHQQAQAALAAAKESGL